MAKRLCKMSRKQIAAELGDIHRLVVAPKFVCRSCARSSAAKDTLCKPAAIPPQKCQDKPLNEQQSCGLLAEALPVQPIPMTTKQSNEKAAIVKRVVERVKEKKQAEKSLEPVRTDAPVWFDLADKKSLKKAKKALKKHYKQQKKLLKVAKKQQKLLKRQRKLEARNAKLEVLLPAPPNALMGASSQAKVH
ncbi:hypothetical protein C408_2243 [Vibrio diabolicus E0666]|uniref:hypothetical protein n=1 Tax=Vibrio diabolicus TaxID=50719 RepID=UPI0002B6F31F|nr:hypothetical protein [Vibrio diabolicus]EMD79319.1 hypothetical protein C408_2243 [Vibrio diabolicus E0666]